MCHIINNSVECIKLTDLLLCVEMRDILAAQQFFFQGFLSKTDLSRREWWCADNVWRVINCCKDMILYLIFISFMLLISHSTRRCSHRRNSFAAYVEARRFARVSRSRGAQSIRALMYRRPNFCCASKALPTLANSLTESVVH